MKKSLTTEKLILAEITQSALALKNSTRRLSMGKMIAMIRRQLGMSQTTLAQLAGLPQPIISQIEADKKIPTMTTLRKVLAPLSCEIVIAPLLEEPIELMRKKQARKIAEQEIGYLRGTMSLEKQEPDKRFIQELLKEKEDALLHGPGSQLWRK